MSQIYEGMFVLDNDAVRDGWEGAKGLVTGVLEKHKATVLSARRWDERRLAYPIQGNRRATYLLAYYQIPGEEIPAMRREFDLSEEVLRYLFLSVDVVPDEEAELTRAEGASDFVVPEPPDDDAPDPEPDPETEGKPVESGRAEPESSDRPAGAESTPEVSQAEPGEPKEKDATVEPAAGDAPLVTEEAASGENPPAQPSPGESDETTEKQEA